MKNFFIVGFLLLITNIAFAQKELQSIDEVNRMCDMIAQSIGQGQNERAMGMIADGMKTRKKSKDSPNIDLKGLFSFLKESEKSYGKLQGSQLGKEEKAGDFLVRYTYGILYDEKPIWISFTYYKSLKMYGLHQVTWGENIEKLLD
ncbi:MAG: hypothetical protein ACPG5B_10260 [Chitinophagales bacterium]